MRTDLGKTEPKKSLLRKVASCIGDGIKHAIYGGGLAIAQLPLSAGIPFIASKMGSIPELSPIITLTKGIENLKKMGLNNFNISKISNNLCPLGEYVDQFNSHFRVPILSVGQIKLNNILTMGVSAPIGEEILFRGIIQDLLLKRIPKYIIKKFSPGNENVLDKKAFKIGRILLTSALFSAMYLMNTDVFGDTYVKTQLISTFVMGIGFGMIKESSLGLLGSIGGHIMNNLVAVLPSLFSC